LLRKKKLRTKNCISHHFHADPKKNVRGPFRNETPTRKKRIQAPGKSSSIAKKKVCQYNSHGRHMCRPRDDRIITLREKENKTIELELKHNGNFTGKGFKKVNNEKQNTGKN